MDRCRIIEKNEGIAKMKNKYGFTKQQVMNSYYSDEELKDMMRMSLKSTLRWLERARRFINTITPKKVKKDQQKMMDAGW